MKLITEINEEVKFISEATDDGRKNMYIEGIFMQAEQKNRNGRMYPLPVMEREVSRYVNDYVNKNRAYGELGHPEGPTINLERVSHMIKELRQEGSNFIGKAKIMDTPYGKIVKNLIDEGAKLGVSSRGIGSIEEKNGVNVVKDDFRLATAADIVADPSAPDAFVRGVMEGKEWIYENGILKEKDIDEIRREISRTSSRNLEEACMKAFQRFISKL